MRQQGAQWRCFTALADHEFLPWFDVIHAWSGEVISKRIADGTITGLDTANGILTTR